MMGRLATAMALGLSACAPIPTYSVTTPIPQESLLPPSAALAEYTSGQGLALQLERTTRQCVVVRHAIAKELDQRDRRLTARQQWLLGIGSFAALAVTVYSGVEKEPESGVLIPLGAVSGTALVSAIPTLGKDDRADVLREKLGALRAHENAVVEAFNALERGLLELGILREQKSLMPDAATNERREIDRQIQDTFVELASLQAMLRNALTGLADQCR